MLNFERTWWTYQVGKREHWNEGQRGYYNLLIIALMDDNHDIQFYKYILYIIYYIYIVIYDYTILYCYSFQTWNQSCTQDRGWKSQGIKMARKIRPDPLHCRYIHLLPPAPQGRRFEALPGEIPEPLSMRLLERQWIVLAVVIVFFLGNLVTWLE